MKEFITSIIVMISFMGYAQIDSIDLKVKQLGHTKEAVNWLSDIIRPIRHSDKVTFRYYSDLMLGMSENLGYTKGVGTSYNLLGTVAWQEDNYAEALDFYLKALRVFEELNDPHLVATQLKNVGIIYDELKQTEKSLHYYFQSLQILEENDMSEKRYNTLINLASTLTNKKSYDSALSYYNEALAHYLKVQEDSFTVALIYHNMGVIYEKREDYSKALDTYKLAEHYIKPSQRGLLSGIISGIGATYLYTGNEKEGMQYLDSALTMAKKAERKFSIKIVYNILVDYYEQNNQHEKAYEALIKKSEIEKEIRGEEVQKTAEVLQLKYEDEKKAKQLALLEKEKARRQAYFTILVISIVALAILGTLIVMLLKLRVKNGLLREAELRTDLEQKNKELTSYTLNFIQKNELMTDLTEEINQLKKKSGSSFIKELNRLNQIIDSNFKIDKDWENFKMMFEEVHKDFFVNLSAGYPNLGNAEVKLCALSRLNLNLKETASVLGISVDSVKTSRYRLRKKLGLKTEENLSDFLMQFDHPRKLEAVA